MPLGCGPQYASGKMRVRAPCPMPRGGPAPADGVSKAGSRSAGIYTAAGSRSELSLREQLSALEARLATAARGRGPPRQEGVMRAACLNVLCSCWRTALRPHPGGGGAALWVCVVRDGPQFRQQYPFTAFTARDTWRQVPAAGCCLETACKAPHAGDLVQRAARSARLQAGPP